jgi:hypothetical protein
MMSALPPKADIAERDHHVRFVPQADKLRCSKMGLFDHLVGVGEQARRNSQTENLRPITVRALRAISQA